MRDEARQWPNLGKHAHLVDLCDHRVQHFALERPEHDGFVLDRIDHEALAGQNQPGTDVVNGGDGYHEPVLTGAGSLHFGVQFLLYRFDQLRAKIARVQENLVLERYLLERRFKGEIDKQSIFL